MNRTVNTFPANPEAAWVDFVVAGGQVRLAGHLAQKIRATGADPVAWFDPHDPALGASPVRSGGRQAAWFVQGPWENGLLRHYRRGGLVARVSTRHYVWQGASRTRCFSEFVLLDQMYRLGLPVPQPLGAIYNRTGPVYRAALVVARIDQAIPLADCLKAADPVAVAGVILKMHDAGVWHADLNAYNILLDGQGRVWLIDFDRGRVRRMTMALRRSNLQRLRRSLCKVAGDDGGRFAQALEAVYLQLASA